MKIILASASPRRRELLKELVDEFQIIPSTKEEIADKKLPPFEYVKVLATIKCLDVASNNKDALVIGSDTIVYHNNEIIGKPKDTNDAKRMLLNLSNNKHEVYTGVCIYYKNKVYCEYDKSDVYFENLKEDFIDKYIATGSPMDKAGSYGVQDANIVKKIDGSYSNVMGLPIELLRKMLSEIKE